VLSAGAFDRLMAALGPFERHPAVAVAVSGGPDSIALLSLAADWAARRDGTVLALTVDHGLRPEAADEARLVETVAARLGVCHRTLVWSGEKPKTGLQEAARAARYLLLGAACEAAGILHLLVAHHWDDQVETHLMRRDRGSGPDGLAGMSARLATAWGQVLRPLLTVPKTALLAHVAERGLPCVDDPSNRDRRFTRVRVRENRRDTDDRAVHVGLCAAAAARAGAEADVAAFLACHAAVDAGGEGVLIDREALRARASEVRRRILTFCLARVGGAPYPPRGERLARLDERLTLDEDMRRRTLAGCLIGFTNRGGERWVSVRPEAARDGRKAAAPAANFQVAPPWTRIT